MRNLMIPLLHIGGGKDVEKDIKTEVKTAIVKGIQKENRVVLQYNHDMSVDPTGRYSVRGTMVDYHAIYCMNLVQTISGWLFRPADARLYVTHTLKRFDLIEVTPDHFVVERGPVERYLAATQQIGDDFAIGVLFDTGYTVHTNVCRVAAVFEPDAQLGRLDILESDTLQFTDMTYVSRMNAMYPIEVELASAFLRTSGGGNAVDFEFSARLANTTNKRAVL